MKIAKLNQLNFMMELIKYQDRSSKLGANGIIKRQNNF